MGYIHVIKKGVNKLAKYIKKPVVVEAVKWTGNNYKVIREFCGAHPQGHGHCWYSVDNKEYISTPEGEMEVNIGDYIVKGVNGYFYICEPNVFEEMYSLMGVDFGIL